MRSKRFLGFIKEGEDKNVYADSAYKSKELEEKVKEMGVEYSVCERAYRNKPLTEEQKERNRELSKVRSRVEHGDRLYEGCNGRLKGKKHWDCKGEVQHRTFEPCVQYVQVFYANYGIGVP